MIRTFFSTITLLGLFFLSFPVFVLADEPVQSLAFDSKKTLKAVYKLEQEYDESTDEEDLTAAVKIITEYQNQANACVKDFKDYLENLKKPLEVLGETSSTDSTEVIQQKKLLKKQKEDAERGLTECQLTVLRSQEVMERFKDILQKRIEHEILTITPPIWRVVTLIFPIGQGTFDNAKFIEMSGFTALSEWQSWAFVLAGVVAFSFAALLQFLTRQKKFLAVISSEPTFLDKLFYSVWVHFVRYSFLIILFGLWSLLVITFEREKDSLTFLAALCYGGLAFSVLMWANRVLLVPVSGAPLVNLSTPEALRMSRQLSVLAFGLLLCSLAYVALLSQSLSVPWLILVRDILVTIFSGQLFWLVWLMGRISVLSGRMKLIRFSFMTVLMAILISEWSGYRNLAEYLLLSFVKTLGVIVSFWLVINLLRDLFEGIAEGERKWQHQIRDMLGLKPYEKQPGVYWFYLMIVLLLWGALFLFLLRIWGMSDANFSTLHLYLVEGFHLADYSIVPMHIGSGILTFFVLSFIFHLVRDRFIKKWLIRTQVERGAREAIISITGYLGFIFAFIIGLSIAGVNFSSLALIAGALSVGIGFGLQNVVNNFISGIILLFERPVKTGDWIKVGQTEGYVRKISIRSTQIQTFDRADVIVPNSDLISQQVTNRMLRDHYGRVAVKVGVAYGSDTQKVRSLLLEIANNHPMVIKSELIAAEPTVLFLDFGDYSLSFELRATIYDIDKQGDVLSDFHFSIDESFRRNGIIIPYPKYDIRVENTDEPKKI